MENYRQEYDNKIDLNTKLGVLYTPAQSTFRLWSPTAQSVTLLLFESDIEPDAFEKQAIRYPMQMNASGTWSCQVHADLEGFYYLYDILHMHGMHTTAVDPYAYAVSVNGQKGAIVDLAKTNPETFLHEAKGTFDHEVDAVIYEMHVRDFSVSSHSGMQNKGKFLAFTEENTRTCDGESTGLDHLQDLGITHVQLMPIFDFKTVDETKSLQEGGYNWGYDPQNYNVPEGSYASDPFSPACRIMEAKQMIHALHSRGIRVIMDVVYNHTYETLTGPFEPVIPGYAYRMLGDGSFANGSGTGNEIATERPMMKKYILDSLKFWLEEYHVDGFRFDLMGLIDRETMYAIVEELRASSQKHLLLLGEPWQAGGSPLTEQQLTTKGSQKNKSFSVFNDHYRNAIKGGTDDASCGFVSGEKETECGIVHGIMGAISDFTASPSEAIQYVTAHDNLNLYDKLAKSYDFDSAQGFLHLREGHLVIPPDADYKNIDEAVQGVDPYYFLGDDYMKDPVVRAGLMANAMILTSQGVPFLHAGEEFCRSKFGDHNSYRSGDAINAMDWLKKKKFKKVFAYYQGLIRLRKEHPAFRLREPNEIQHYLKIYIQEPQCIAFSLADYANEDTWREIVVIYHARQEETLVQLPVEATWHVVVNGEEAGCETLETVNDYEICVAPQSVYVLYRTS